MQSGPYFRRGGTVIKVMPDGVDVQFDGPSGEIYNFDTKGDGRAGGTDFWGKWVVVIGEETCADFS